ncbi:hypothetical protein Y032_0018g3658 [Ancylostoma ceylanicum]|nr:hypothetical protein Y032_0018g3658 [Ancylostoma ceylanicum]
MNCLYRNHIPASEDFERWSLTFEKFVKVLSPYNTFMVAIHQKFLSAAEGVGRTDLTSKYADICLDAYRRYLPVGHPELTHRLRLAYLRKLQECSRQSCRALLVEVTFKFVVDLGIYYNLIFVPDCHDSKACRFGICSERLVGLAFVLKEVSSLYSA